jgi:hypothetical protein
MQCQPMKIVSGACQKLPNFITKIPQNSYCGMKSNLIFGSGTFDRQNFDRQNFDRQEFLTDRISTDKNFDRQNIDRREFWPTEFWPTRILTGRILTDENFDRREFWPTNFHRIYGIFLNANSFPKILLNQSSFENQSFL